jgi:hypothetical protein
MASPPRTFGGDDCSSRAQKRIENKITSGRAVPNRIGDQRNGLWGGMQGQERFPSESERRCSLLDSSRRSSVLSELAQLDVVPVRSRSVLEQEHQLMRAPIEAAHSAIALRPDA